MSWLVPRNPEFVAPDEALPGRSASILPNPAPHAVLGTPLDGPWREDQQVVWIAMGCFWGAEKLMWQLPGVESTAVGYAGGLTPNPTYREVCSGLTNHAEVVQVVFAPKRIALARIIATALENHDPTQGFRQGNDVGTQYRSAIYLASESDTQLVSALVDSYGARLADAGFGALTTEVIPLSHTPAGQFYLAEEEHQQYLYKVPGGYCPNHATGVTCG